MTPAKKESLSVQIRTVLTESVLLFTTVLVFLGIDAFLAWIWPNEKAHHGFLDFVIVAGWMVLVFKLKLFPTSPQAVAGKAVYAARFVVMLAYWTLGMTILDSWYPNSTGRSYIVGNIISGLIFAGFLSYRRPDRTDGMPPPSRFSL
jgi:hypothetical protein